MYKPAWRGLYVWDWRRADSCPNQDVNVLTSCSPTAAAAEHHAVIADWLEIARRKHPRLSFGLNGQLIPCQKSWVRSEHWSILSKEYVYP